MEDQSIPDTAIKSFTTNTQTRTRMARLHSQPRDGLAAAWMPTNAKNGTWLQINLGKIYEITAVATQGRQDADQWVTKYMLKFSSIVGQWQSDPRVSHTPSG